MRKAIIAGCGYVGLATARRFAAAGWEVIGLTHSTESVERMNAEAFAVVACDITDRDQLAGHVQLRGADVVLHCASSGRGGAEQYRNIYLNGAQNLAEVLRPTRLLFTSSTSVYAQTSGEWVSEESSAEPFRETGQILRATEELVLAAGGTVTRLAGIYGPGRSVLLRRFLAGEAVIEGDGSRWINQAHRDDIATALLHVAEAGLNGIFNVCDDTPMTQRAVYEWLAAHFGKPLPPSGRIDPNRKRGWTNKRVGNARLRATGWAPCYTSFPAALEKSDLLNSA